MSRITLWTGISVFVFCAVAGAVDDSSSGETLPAKTQIRLKVTDDIHVLSNTGSTSIGKLTPGYYSDEDGDGVSDGRDFCPGTAPGVTVWKLQDVLDKKTKGINVGCSGAAQEKHLAKEDTPHETLMRCSLNHDISVDERVLEKSKIFEIKAGRQVKTDDSEGVEYDIATPGGFELKIDCTGYYYTMEANADGSTSYGYAGNSVPNVGQMKRIFEIVSSPAPIVIAVER